LCRSREHHDVKHHLYDVEAAGDLSLGVHVPEPDGAQRRNREVERIRLCFQTDELRWRGAGDSEVGHRKEY